MNSHVPKSPNRIPSGDACAQCRLEALCLPFDLAADELHQVDKLAIRRRVKRDAFACRIGARFRSLFAIRSGVLKSRALFTSGCEQIMAFHMTGDFFGIDGIGNAIHMCDVIALEDAELCELPFHELEQLSRALPALQHALHRIISNEIVRQHEMMVMLGNMQADERLTAFLLSLSRRLTVRGLSPTELDLPMSRADIGSYLGMSIETVSRALARLQAHGFIRVCQRRIRLVDIEALKAKLGEHEIDNRSQPPVARPPGFSGNSYDLASFSGKTRAEPFGNSVERPACIPVPSTH